MRRQNTESLKDAIQRYLKAMKVDKRLLEIQIVKNWHEYVGMYMAQATKEIYIRDGILFVHFYSSIVRNELMMIREPLCDKINESVGEVIIREIVLR